MERANELRRLAATPGLPAALVAHLTTAARLAEPAPTLTLKAMEHLVRRRAAMLEVAG